MATTFENLDTTGTDMNYKSSHPYNGLNCNSYHEEELASGNSSANSDKVKTEQFLSNTVVAQKKTAFEQFVKSIFKDSKEIIRHFEGVKNSLGSKIEQVFSSETMIEYFDRISQKPISRIGNTKKTRWSDDEVLLLTHIVIYYTFSHPIDFETLSAEAWEDISSIFPNKDASQLKKRWQGCLKKTLWQVPWTQQEDDLLVRIITEKGHTRKWKEIAEELNARSDLEVYRHGRQCRERWNNHLDPSILRNPFTDEEDVKLFQLYKELGKKWAEISKKMKNRTENAVKNRFNSLIKKLKNGQNKSLCENPSMGSTESDGDSLKQEQKLVDQFLQRFANGGTEGKTEPEKTRTNEFNHKNILYEHSEAIFESDSDSYTHNHKQTDYLDKALPRKKGSNPNRTQILGEFKECLRKMPSSNFHMEEEYGMHSHMPLKSSNKFENIYPNQNERINSLSVPPSYYNSFGQFPHTYNPSLRRDGSMTCEGSMIRSSSKVPYYDNYQLKQNSRLPPNYLLTNSGASFDIGLKNASNPLIGNGNYDHAVSSMDSLKASKNNLSNYLDCENSNVDSPLKPNRFPFDNYENKFSSNAHMKFEEDMNEMSPTKRLSGINHQLKAKRLDSYRTQCQIGRSNLQFAIVDLTKNEVYMVHPVTKENFNGTISKMSEEDTPAANLFDNIPNSLKTSEFLMLGKSGEHSPSIGYIQSLISSKPSFISDNSTLTGAINLFNHPAETAERPKAGSMTTVGERYQDIMKKFGLAPNQENQLKQKNNDNTSL